MPNTCIDTPFIALLVFVGIECHAGARQRRWTLALAGLRLAGSGVRLPALEPGNPKAVASGLMAWLFTLVGKTLDVH